MKTTKKALSVLLAVIMIMSSMSVCFGTFNVGAANVGGDYDEDPLEYLAEHLNGETIKWVADNCSLANGGKSGTESVNHDSNLTYTTNVELPTYEMYCEVRDCLIYLDMAIRGTTEFGKAVAGNTDYETRACTCSGFIEEELLGALGSSLSAAGKEFIEYLLYDHYATQHSNANSTESRSHDSHTTTLNVYTTDVKGYLKEVGDYTNVESSVELGYTHRIYLTEGYYEKTTLGFIKTKYRHNYLKYADNTAAPTEIADKANKTIKTTVTNYANTVDNTIATYTFEKMAGMSVEAIEEIVTGLKQARTDIKAVVNRDSLDNYSTLFPGYDAKISEFETTANKAKEIAGYTTTVAEITAYQNSNPDYGVFNWGGFDEATIKADYADFMGKYGSIINDATLYEFFTNNGSISDTYVKNFRDNAIAYDLEDLKEDKILPLYNKYALSFPMEGGEEIPLAEKQAAYSNLSGYINNVRSYTEQVQNAIFPESLNTYLDLQEKLECQVAECVLYFAEHVGQDYSNVATEDVIKEIGTAKAQLNALNALLASVDYADNTTLLDSAFENADEFIAYLYSLLGERYTAQVEITDSTYTAIGRPNSNLTIKQYSQLNAYVNGIEQEIVEFLDAEGQGALVTAETRAKYAAIQSELMPAFNAFEIDRGFNNYSPEDVLIRREDNFDEIFRQNADLDDDGIGEYEVTDANVNAIVDLLEAALKDPTIAGLLGDLINKDEDGNPTGEAFSLSGLITNLLNESVFTDELINTIIQFVYPLVLKEFAKVWAGLPPTITITVENVVGSLGADVACGLDLDDVETAIASVGLYIGPKALASNLSKNFSQYTQVINKLNEATIKAQYNKEKDTFRNPWEDTVLFKTVENDDGTTKQVYDLNWGINEATDKRKAFVDAAVAALSGLEPLLMAIISNKDFTNPDVTDGDARGVKIGTGSGSASVSIVTLNLTIDPITLTLTFDKNDGWDNALAPIFEAMGLTNIPHSEELQTTRKLLENGLLAMIDQLIAKLDANPIQFLLDALPNLAYALEGGLVEPLLHQLKTVINYYADAYYDASLVKDTLKDAMKSEEPILINIGEMINLKDMGLDISNFAAIWNMIAGGVELLANAEAPDAAYIASLGKLVEKDTNRSVKTYTAGTAGKAYHINANRADVLQYLVKWVLESGLLAGIVAEPSELVASIFTNLENNSGDAVAAIVELLTQQTIYDAKNFNWFDGTIDGENVLGNSATAIYLNPNNDWTEDKAEYLYNNIDALVTSILTMAKLDLNKETEEIDGSIGEVIGGAIDGLLSDKTLTSLAALLAGLDLNALLAGDAEDETATVAEGEETEAPALDVTALINDLLGIDLSVFAAEGGMYKTIAAELEADENYVYDFGVDEGTTTFAAALADLIAPLSKVLDFILAGENLEITLGTEEVTLIGADGYNNGLIPLLEALGCDVTARADLGETSELEAVINALVARIDALTEGDVIKNIINLLPGVLYFITSNGLSTSVLNLLQPIVVIIDTIRPVINVMDLINNIEVGEEGAKQPLKELLGGEIDLERLDVNFIFKLLPMLLPDLDLSGLKNVIYDVCNYLGVTYTSKSTLQSTWKKGAYNDNFSQADMLTVVLSFVLEWATVKENAEKLDELLKTDGLISSITTVLAGVKVNYTDPDWMYWFDTEEEFNNYIANGSAALPNTLLALEYPNDWNDVTAQYIADNLASLVDMVIGLINKDKGEDAPKTVADLLGGLLNGYLTKDSLNQLVDLIVNLLSNIDATLIETAGVLLDANIAGLETYEAPEIVATEDTTLTEAFAAELANVLDTYAGRIIDWLFFGDDYRFAKKSDKTDTIVINGGLGYEKGLAMILEALGCKLPVEDTTTEAKEVNTKSVLGALAARVDEILAAPVDEVLDLLPNLVYFLNANGAGAAVSNILAPVVALLDALAIEGVKLDLADLIKIKKDDGTEVKLNLGALTLANIVNFVESLTGLNLTAVENILVDFCVGKITKGTYIYKMTADKSDVVTIVLTTALLVLKNEQNADVIGVDAIAALDEVFESAPVTYGTPNWDYCWDTTDIDYVYGTIGVIESALNYPNDWTEETSQYVAANLSKLVDMVIGLIEIDGTKYESLAALIDAKLNIYTADNLKAIQTALGDLIGGLDGDLKNIVDVALGAADSLLGADVQGLLDYDVSGVNSKKTFVAALTGMLMEVEGLVDWLLFGEDYELFVDDDGDMVYEDGEAIITLNGGHGYAEGLALLLEALGCEDLPTVYDKNTIDTEATVKAVLTSLANRIDEVLDNPVDEVIDLLPNLIYFLNTNGVAAVIDNLIGAINALLIKLEGVGLEVNINDLVNIKELMGIEGTDAAISLDNLAMKDILQAVSLMTGLDLTVLEGTLNGFALGNVKAYPSVSRTGATFKMQYEKAFDKADMITVLVTAVLNVLETGDNAEKIDEMANTNLVSAIRDVFMGGTVVYTAPNWDYTNDTKYEVKYPNNWTEATAIYVADNLVEIGDMIAGLIDANYATLGELLTDKVNVFTTDNLDKLVELINNLLGDIDATLIEGAGLLLGAKLVGDDSLATYKAPDGIATAEEFAAELANVLSTYAPGVVEWLFFGESYKFFVNDANGDDEFNNGKYTEGEDAITINGAQGYAEGLALLLEALGCEELPAVYDTEGNALELDTAETIKTVLVSLGKRIDYILANPVVEVVNLLPNLFYFLNTNGVAAIVDNLTAGITALLGKLEAFGVELNINDLVNLKSLMGLEDTDATISLDNLAMKDILQAVSLMVGIDLTYIEKVLVNFNLGEVAAYDSVSQYAGETKKMTYVTTFKDHDMITVIANLLLITLADAKNEAVIKDLLGADIYAVIIDVLNLETAEAPIQYMDWKATDRVGDTFNALETSPTYKGFEYGPLYTEEMAQYIADNIGEFIDNIIYLLGLEINGVNVESLEDLLNNLVGGSLYNSSLVITIRDALAGLATSIEGLEVNGKVVGNHIVEILKTAKIADLKKVANVNVPEFSDDKAQFIASLCDVLEPLYPVLTWLLADTDLAFFVDTDMNDFITLPGAEGYRNGIALLLEAIGCENLPTELNGEGEAVVLAILNPLLNRLDEIFANPAEEILAVLTNVIYFINSNGVDVVIKNTLNAVYTVLAAIEPVAKVDLYELVGLDAYVTLSAEELIDMLLSKLEVAGFDFTAISVDLFSELTVGKLTKYTSISAEGANAYKMVYDAENANEADMVTAVMRLVITFILTENNREVLIDLLKDALGMSADAEKYVSALLKAFADVVVGKEGEDLRLGMDSVLATIYYIFYSLDKGVDGTVAGKDNLSKLWAEKIKELNDNSPSENTQVGDLITDIFDIIFNDEDENGNFPVGGGNDVADKEEIAPNGFIAFFQRIAKFFEEIGEFFRKLFSFGK